MVRKGGDGLMRRRLEAAREAALAAGRLVRREFDRMPAGPVEEKGPNDFVTPVDRASEELIRGIIGRLFPGEDMLAEESPGELEKSGCWIVDPLDGTTNFIHRYPYVGVSISWFEEGRVMAAVTYDPVREEVFEAVRGGGASCNGKPMTVSSSGGLETSLLGTGFPFRAHEHLDPYIGMFKELFLQCRGIRRAGAAVIDLALVAAGRLDGFWEIFLKPWDIAAGSLLIEEAGGTVTDLAGGRSFLSSGHIAAGAPAVHRAILEAASGYFAGGP